MTSTNADKKIHKTDWLGNIGCVVILLAFVGWGAVIYNGVHHSLNRGTIALSTEISVNDNVITLVNKDSFDWQFIYFSLDTDNDPENYEYSYYLSSLDKHQTININLTKFKKSDSSFFDPLTIEPKHLSFFAETSQGTGHYIYTWPGF